MPERDAFEGAYGRLAATRVTAVPPPRPSAAATEAAGTPALRWAASRLLPRLTALAPRRRGRRARPRDD